MHYSMRKPSGSLCRTNLFGAICVSFFALFTFIFYAYYSASPMLEAALQPLRGSQSRSEDTRSETNIAFFIQAYSKTIPLMPSLLDVLWHPNNIYAIHVDAKTTEEQLQPLKRLLRYSNYSTNVHLMRPHHVTYLGISTLISTQDAISFLLSISDNWEYFINLSGADYPFVSANHIRKILSAPHIRRNKLNFIQAFADHPDRRDFIYESRFHKIHVDTSLYQSIIDHNTTHKPKGREADCVGGCLWKTYMDSHPLFKSYMGRIPFVKSEAWVILHRSFAKYAIDSPLARRYTAVLSNIPCPEEFYFGTVLALSEEFRDTAVYDGFRCVLWSHKKEKSSRAPEIDGGKIPTIYSVLRASGALFGRKRMKVTSPVKTFIDDEILGVSLSPAERADPNHAANKFLAKALRRVECMSQFRRKRGEYNLELRQCLNK